MTIVGVVREISGQFATSAEYLARNRGNGQYVGDLYNAYMRRGGDSAGVMFWIGELNANRRSRDLVRQQFEGVTEFQARLIRVTGQDCLH